VLVRDSLASGTPRAWEWNIHTPEHMERVSDRVVTLRNGPAILCLEMLASPEVAFRADNHFTPPPEGNPKPADQWHGVFAATAKTPEAEFVALMRVGSACKSGEPDAHATKIDGGWRVDVGSAHVTFNGDEVRVQ